MLRPLLLFFLRIVNLTFGGGEPTMAACFRELVQHRKWLTPEQYGLAFGLARITPGTNLIAFCVGCGWLLARARGALGVALVSTVPSACVVVWFTVAYEGLQSNAAAMAAIAGMVAAAIGLMWGAAAQLLRPHLNKFVRTIVIAGSAFALSAFAGLSPVWCLAAGGLLSVIWPRREAQ